jgi:uncharacterized protein
MRVILSGGTGSIGIPLSNMLVEAEHEVFVLSRNPDRRPTALSKVVELRKWDTKTGEGWADLINSQTAIINLAGKSPMNWRWTAQHKQQVLDSRINAAKAMIDACQNASEKPAVLLQASAVGYYGDTGQEVIYENHPAGDTWRAGVCDQWEATLKPVEAMDIRVAYLRIGIVLDPKGGALPPFILGAQLMGRQLGDGKQWIPWIHNDDVSGAIRFIMEDDTLQGAFNLSTPNPTQNREFFNILTSILSRPSLFPVPAIALKLAMGEMAKVVLDSQRVIPQKLNDAGYIFHYPDLENTLRELL